MVHAVWLIFLWPLYGALACLLSQSTLMDGQLCHENCTGGLSVVRSIAGFSPSRGTTLSSALVTETGQYKDCNCFCLQISWTNPLDLIHTTSNGDKLQLFTSIAPLQHYSGSMLSFAGDKTRPLLDIQPNAFSAIDFLATLAFHQLKITNFPDHFLPKYIRRMEISHCGITTVPLQLRSIIIQNSLQLAGNELTELSGKSSAFPKAWTDLFEVDLYSNKLTSFPRGLFSLKSLQRLSIQENKIAVPYFTLNQIKFLEQLHTFGHDFKHSTAALNCCGKCRILVNTTDPGSAFSVCLRATTDEPQPKTKFPESDQPEKKHTVPKIDKGKREYDVVSGDAETGINPMNIGIPITGSILLIMIAAYFHRSRQKKKKKFEESRIICSLKDSMCDARNISVKADVLSSDLVLNALRIPFGDVNLDCRIANGACGNVWLGYYCSFRVAVKTLVVQKNFDHHIDNFIREIKLLAVLDHPKIVIFFGVAWKNMQDIEAVTEFMDRGDLQMVLRSKSSRQLSWCAGKVTIAIDIAEALSYLHNRDPIVIHHDLKSRNILVDCISGTKLSDFGTSKELLNNDLLTGGSGTARWMAPEVVNAKEYNQQADIYSFGVVLSELDTHNTPFEDEESHRGEKLQSWQILYGVGQGTLTPKFSSTCPDYILKIAQKCLQFDPALRPTAKEVLKLLKQVAEKVGG